MSTHKHFKCITTVVSCSSNALCYIPSYIVPLPLLPDLLFFPTATKHILLPLDPLQGFSYKASYSLELVDTAKAVSATYGQKSEPFPHSQTKMLSTHQEIILA